VLLLSPALVDEPLGMMYLASALRRAGHRVEGILFNHATWDPASIGSFVQEWDPDLVAFSVITGEHLQCLELSRTLRDVHRHFTLLGGPYLTFAPQVIRAHAHVDAIARGECEHAVVELCDRLRSGRDHLSLENFWFRDGDGIVENPLGPLPPIDELPRPDREVFATQKADGVFNLMSSRGCPYKCTYCFNDRFVEIYRPASRGGQRVGNAPAPVVRNREIASVIDEMRDLAARFDVEQFNFHDDIFPIRKSRTIEFCEAYLASGIDIAWSCSVKAELLDAELVDAMATGGCNKVYMGVEAGDDRVRNDLLLRRVDRDEMAQAAALIHAAGIQLFTQSMVGLPGTMLDDDLATMAFNAELRPTFAWVSIFMPYPGTALADRTLAMGLVDPDFMDTMPNTYHHRSILRFPHAVQVSILHKVFSLGVDFPELLPQLAKLVANGCSDDIDALHESVFLPFRTWKHHLLADPSAAQPPELVTFIDALHRDDVDEALALVRARHIAGPAGQPTSSPWIRRDGVDVVSGHAPSADRHAAQP